MCGIVGFTESLGSREHNLGVLEQMLKQIAHRGPEGNSLKYMNHLNVSFGHCRLSFVEPQHILQPAISSDSRIILVFNGEIYNYAELKEELETSGFDGSLGGEASVILKLYQREGLEFVRCLRGMYAIAIYDGNQERVILIRDALGQKPLYYFLTSGGVVFASELKALLKHPRCQRQIDYQALGQYFVFNVVPSPRTLFAKIFKVNPGSMVVLSKGAIEEKTYWSVPVCENSLAGVSYSVKEKLEGLLTESVKRRVGTTEFPMGVLLSGGVDSSLIAAIAQGHSSAPIKTFSAGFDEASHDESRYAQQVATHLGTDHHTIMIGGKNVANVIKEKYRMLDEPLADPSLMPMILITEKACQYVKGVLSGDGADEMLMGYSFFPASMVLRQLERWLPKMVLALLIRRVQRLPVKHSNLHHGYILNLFSRGIDTLAEEKFYQCTSAFNMEEFPNVINAEILKGIGNFVLFHELEKFLDQSDSVINRRLSYLERVQLGMICHFLRDVILTKVDRASMLNSLEVRSPFLDIDLVELAFKIPMSLKLKRTTTKFILKKVAEKYLPLDIVHRKKRGFRAPISALLCDQLHEMMLELLSEQRIKQCGLFNYRYIKTLIDGHLSMQRDHQKQLWSLLCFQIWYDEYMC